LARCSGRYVLLISAPLDLTAPFNLVTIRVPGTQGPVGPVGPANSLGIGTVTTGAAGSSAAATITGTAPNQILNLTIPRGNTGVAGPANVLTIGTVTTSAPGSSAVATITGTAPNQILNLTLPQGAQGPVGAGAPDATATAKGSIKLAGDMGGTADIPRVTSQADRAYVRSFAATDLVANGTAYLGDNSNFSSFTLDKTDSPVGGGSFDTTTGVGKDYIIDELLPIDLSRRYLLRFQVKQKGVGNPTSYMYAFLAGFDIDGFSVNPEFYMFQNNTTTTLAAPLAPGDTTVQLTSAANWNNAAGTNNHLRTIIFWNYTDLKGKTWPVETYSRRVKLNVYADGGISGNTITLSAPFDPTQWGYPAGTTIAAGTSLSNGGAGGTYMYGNGMANIIVPSTWTMYESIYVGGTMPKTNGGRSVSADANTGFPPGAAFVKVGWLLNTGPGAVGSVAASKVSVAAVSLSDATATDYDVRRATALSTASTIVKRNSFGDAAVNQMDLAATAPVQPYHVTRKDYVDLADRTPARIFSGLAHTIDQADENKMLYTVTPGPVVYTVPTDTAFPAAIGFTLEILRGSGDPVTIQPADGTVAIIGPDSGIGTRTIRSEFGLVRLRKYATNSWTIEGDLDLNLGTSVNTFNTIMRRNATGHVEVTSVDLANGPAAASHATRKDYVDAVGTSAANANTIARRDTNGNLDAVSIGLGAAPTAAQHATRKDYVDTQIATRAATSHTHTATNISDSTAIGRTVLTAADAPAIRTAIGAGTSNLAIGTTSTTAKAGDYQPTAANISDATVIGRTVLTSVDATAVRTAIGAGTSSLVIGTTSTTAKAGDYAPPDATTAVKGLVQLTNHLGGTATAPTVRSATSAQTGIVQLATTTEATAAADTTKAVTPAGLADRVLNVSGVSKVQKITQAAYTALGTKDAATLYLIVG
jgi:hypothetical protein